nr:hypothetical protein [Tanacetum cinerariifolium]
VAELDLIPPILELIKGVKMEKRNIRDRNVLSIDDHRAFSRRLESLKAQMRE